mgnify:CR=1 FL=1
MYLLQQLFHLGDIHRGIKLGDGLVVLHHVAELLKAFRFLNYLENRAEGTLEATGPVPHGCGCELVDVLLRSDAVITFGLERDLRRVLLLFEWEPVNPALVDLGAATSSSASGSGMENFL